MKLIHVVVGLNLSLEDDLRHRSNNDVYLAKAGSFFGEHGIEYAGLVTMPQLDSPAFNELKSANQQEARQKRGENPELFFADTKLAL